MFSNRDYLEEGRLTRFESLCIESVAEALNRTKVKLDSKDTIFILSTTKGNIDELAQDKLDENLRARLALQATAKTIAAYFFAANPPLVVSNACTSGLLAMIIAKRLIDAGQYKHAVITGADSPSEFVITGFSSLGAMGRGTCKPFDKSRNGINLGEAAATVVLSSEEKGDIAILSGASSNDANHISGPSRTGDELAHAINVAMKDAQISANDLSFISAHGTATIFNDEMESKAFQTAGLSYVPLHSLKANFGHTLGAAGVVESIMSIHSLREGIVLPSKNFEESGVSAEINVNQSLIKSKNSFALKTASGFGGCNAAAVFAKL